MLTETVNHDTVTLESIGPVDVSHIYFTIDEYAHASTKRPWPGYHEVAILWGDTQRHCYIADSNLTDKAVADALFQFLTDPTRLATFMVHMFHNVPTYEWD